MDPHPLHPLSNHTCPLCGAPNECAAAISGSFDTPCWCRNIVFPDELLATVPADLKGKSCICRACVESAANAAIPSPEQVAPDEVSPSQSP
ncbi:cysteine-rich CWC family protein [Luteolibacter luteus]|uniref:Cysteine-rich CWC family protein n=1 Tax=Luteolibacter luteus TaxID=2728835 RepID=A0A858RSM2_9BACT|nr:cysteine-rich CWC family protein [Luteolibacter luteus]